MPPAMVDAPTKFFYEEADFTPAQLHFYFTKFFWFMQIFFAAYILTNKFGGFTVHFQ